MKVNCLTCGYYTNASTLTIAAMMERRHEDETGGKNGHHGFALLPTERPTLATLKASRN